jgi:protein TonB
VRRLRLSIVTRPLTTVQRFIAASVFAHAALTSALVWIPDFRDGPRIPQNATVVELVGALPARAPRPTTTVPEPVEVHTAPQSKPPKKPPEEASLEPPEPRATPEPRPDPVEVQPSAATRDPLETGPDPESTMTDTPTADEDTAGSPSTGGSVSAFDLGDTAFSWYRSAVANALYGNWRRPILSGVREPVEVRVAFEIMRDGNVRGLRVEQSSGVPMLDRSALRAVSDATPLPALPTNLREPYLPASIVFRLYPDGY